VFSSCFFVIFVPCWFAVVLIRLIVMFGSLVIMFSMVFSIWVNDIFDWGIIFVYPHRVLSRACEYYCLFCFFYLKFEVFMFV